MCKCYTVPSVSPGPVWYGRKSIWIQDKRQNRNFHALQCWQGARVRGGMLGGKALHEKNKHKQRGKVTVRPAQACIMCHTLNPKLATQVNSHL